MWLSLVKLARPAQWAKGAFVLVGPMYALGDAAEPGWGMVWPALVTVVIFGLASSGCYVVNDLLDVEADRAHPRKRRRPIASGAVSVGTAKVYAAALFASSAGLHAVLPAETRWLVALVTGLYVLNVGVYSWRLKHIVIADVVCLSLGFVLRVLAGCASVGVGPTTWLLNCTLFVAMFLSFGKRLGERRTLGVEGVSAARAVQGAYTDELLRMAVVVTAVASLLSYAGYVEAREDVYRRGFNLLWLTLLPATYGMLRCMVLLERGAYDDPTELASKDRAFQAAGMVFAFMTGGLWWLVRSWPVATGE